MRSEKLLKGVGCRVNLHPRVSFSTSSLYFDSLVLCGVGRGDAIGPVISCDWSVLWDNGTSNVFWLVSLLVAPLVWWGDYKKWWNNPSVYPQIQRFIDWCINIKKYFDHLYLKSRIWVIWDFIWFHSFRKNPKNIYIIIIRTILLPKGRYIRPEYEIFKLNGAKWDVIFWFCSDYTQVRCDMIGSE